MPFLLIAAGVILICGFLAFVFGLAQGDEPFSYGIGGCVLGVILVLMGAIAFFALRALAGYLIPICGIGTLMALLILGAAYWTGMLERERWQKPPSGDLVYRFRGTSNTRDVLGPLELENGVYIVQYKVRGEEGSTPGITISMENIGSAELIDVNAVASTEIVGAGPMQIQAVSDSQGGLCEGKESLRLPKGYYLIKLRFEQAKQWELTLYRAEVRKEKSEA